LISAALPNSSWLVGNNEQSGRRIKCCSGLVGSLPAIHLVGKGKAEKEGENGLKRITDLGHVLVDGINLANKQDKIMAMREIPL
jgi:hypothetical protein